jgi:hypothetical protein
MSKGKGADFTSEEVKIRRQGHSTMGHRAFPFLLPWGLLVLVYLVSVVTWLTFHNPLAYVLLAIMVGGLTWVTRTTWKVRHQHARNAATAFTGGMGVWLLAATWIGPFHQLTAYAWVLIGAFLAATWNIRYAGLTPTNKHDQPMTTHVEPLHAIKKLKSFRTKKVKEGDGFADIYLQGDGRATADDVRSRTKNIAGVYGVDPSSVTASDVPGRGDQVKVTVRPDNPTSAVVSWSGTSAPGKSVAEAPLRIGKRADGTPLALWVVGKDDPDDPRPLPHTLWTGMNGSGKTSALVNAIIDGRSRTDFVPVVGDPVKFMQSFGDVADALAIAAAGRQQTERLITNLPETIAYRADLLGRLGYQQWEPECYTLHGIPLVFFSIEEAAVVVAKNEAFKSATATARSVGIAISASMQVAVYRNIERETRSQFSNSLAFGVSEMQDAAFALTPGTLAAGADPTRWKNNEPGRCYAELIGYPSDQWVMECRAAYSTRSQRRAELEMSRPHWAQLDSGTAMLLGAGIERPDAALPYDTIKVPDPEQRPVQTLEMPPVKLSLVKPTPEGARDMVDDMITTLDANGVQVITYSDLEGLTEQTGRSRSWVYSQMDRLEHQGRLVPEPGSVKSYRIQHQVSDGQTAE